MRTNYQCSKKTRKGTKGTHFTENSTLFIGHVIQRFVRLGAGGDFLGVSTEDENCISL